MLALDVLLEAEAVPSLDVDALELYKVMLTSREADLRETSLYKQGEGRFQLPSAGHEAMAVVAYLLQKEDMIFSHYRDRALLLARGVSLSNIALEYFAKRDSSSGGRQMASHFQSLEHNIMPSATPTGLLCLPAAGVAWAMKKKRSSNIAICCMGDATARQGEFFEALAFSIQENLPILFIVEDNGYGVSTPTHNMNPKTLGMLPRECLTSVNGNDPFAMYFTAKTCIAQVREGNGPAILWVKCDRLMSHTSSDDQSLYRPKAELDKIKKRDPLHSVRNHLIKKLSFAEEELDGLQSDIKAEVQLIYKYASKAADPTVQEIAAHVLPEAGSASIKLDGNRTWTMVEAANKALSTILSENRNVVMLGEDIEDPKGGVFGMSKGLSSRFPHQVHNSPLAEATIAGLASGLVMMDMIPVFELQFIDFVGTALNQLFNQLGTLCWRSNGRIQGPSVFLAPCGGYISGAGPWHSQSGESLLSHAYGIRVVMPHTAQQAADAIASAVGGQGPVVILLPKKQFFRKFNLTDEDTSPSSVVHEGEDITLVCWGNCVEVAEQAKEELLKQSINCELIALKTLYPIELDAIKASLAKTGRLIVIQEDARTCSIGQSIIAELAMDIHVWDMMFAPPMLISRPDMLLPFHHNTMLALLPDVEKITHAVLHSLRQ